MACLPLICTVLCRNVSHRGQSLALPTSPSDTGIGSSLSLPTLKAGKESPGGYPAAADGHTEAGMSGSGVCWMPAQGRKATWLPSSLGQPRSLARLAPWLGSRNPGSGSWFAPRHWGDAGSGLRLPWEPRPGQAWLTTPSTRLEQPRGPQCLGFRKTTPVPRVTLQA